MRTSVVLAIAGATAVAAASGIVGYKTLEKDVTVAVDGQPTNVATFAPTVGAVLKDQGITVGENDEVAPSLDTSLADGTQISVRYGRQVTITVDGAERKVWTTERSVEGLLASLNLPDDKAELSTSRSAAIGREGMSFALATEKQVVVVVSGKDVKLATNALTVGEALSEAKVKPDADDKVSNKPTDRLSDGMRITYVKVDTKTTTEDQPVSHDTKQVKSPELVEGTTKTTTKGVNGVKTLTFTERYEDGKRVSRVKAGEKVTKAPVTEVVTVGTKAKPVEKADPPARERASANSTQTEKKTTKRTENPTKPKPPVTNTASGSVWDRLAKCESGGNWSINTGNGYYGGLQFSAQTWRGFGGTAYAPYANRATRDQQITIAKKVQASQGWGAWPACTRKLGIR